MRSLATLLFGILAVSSFAQEVKYKVLIDGNEVGEAKSIHQSRPDGSFRTVIEMRIGPTTVKSEDITAADGMPISKSFSQSATGYSSSSLQRFSKTGMTATVTTNGKTITKTLPYPKTGTMKSPAGMWFFTIRPKLGAQDKSWSFNPATVQWEEKMVQYKRDETIQSKGKSVKAHLLDSKTAKVWASDKGLPYRVDLIQPSMVIRLEMK